MRQLASSVRKIAREESLRAHPPAARYRVAKIKPLLVLESLGSDDRLVEGEDGFDVGKMVKKEADVGETVIVATDEHGDKMAVEVLEPAK